MILDWSLLLLCYYFVFTVLLSNWLHIYVILCCLANPVRSWQPTYICGNGGKHGYGNVVVPVFFLRLSLPVSSHLPSSIFYHLLLTSALAVCTVRSFLGVFHERGVCPLWVLWHGLVTNSNRLRTLHISVELLHNHIQEKAWKLSWIESQHSFLFYQESVSFA